MSSLQDFRIMSMTLRGKDVFHFIYLHMSFSSVYWASFLIILRQTKIPQLRLTPPEKRNEAFSQIYIFFEALKRSWKQDYRPIISVDGIFLKHYVQEIILTAIGSDPNTQIYIIAWNVVSVKYNEN